MRILFVVEHYYPFIGGAETLFKNLAEGLVKKGHRVTVVTSMLKDTTREEKINGVQVYRINVPQFGRRYWFTFLADLDVFWFAKDVDIIQTTTYNGAWPAWIVSKFLKKPCVLTVHEVLSDTWDLIMNPVMASVHKLAERTILKLGFDKYVAVSDSTKRDIQKYISYDRVQRIYNGIDYEHFRPYELSHKRDSFTYAYFGRYGVTKGVDHLVEASHLVHDKIPKSKCFIFSKGYPQRKDNIVESFMPLLYEDLPKAMAAMDCIVIPSLSEGFGYTAAEACAVGVPVVASCVGSLPEVVSGKYVFCLPRDPQSIADAVIKVYKGEYNTSPLRKFTWEDCVNQYEILYQGLICQKR